MKATIDHPEAAAEAGNEDPFLTPKQLAKRWKCSTMKLRRMRRSGKLPVTYIVRSARYALAEVVRIEAESTVNGAAA